MVQIADPPLLIREATQHKLHRAASDPFSPMLAKDVELSDRMQIIFENANERKAADSILIQDKERETSGFFPVLVEVWILPVAVLVFESLRAFECFGAKILLQQLPQQRLLVDTHRLQRHRDHRPFAAFE